LFCALSVYGSNLLLGVDMSVFEMYGSGDDSSGETSEKGKVDEGGYILLEAITDVLWRLDK